MFPRNAIWLIPAFPLLGALLNGMSAFFGIKYPKKLVSSIAVGVMLAAFGVSLATVIDLAQSAAGTPREYVDFIYSWIHVGKLEIPLGFLIDPLSCVMILIVTGVGSLIHIYSVGYMAEDPGYQRFL